MLTQHNGNTLSAARQRDRCYGCFRPRSDCFCDTIPAIDNSTDVLILQHRRERFHPFNTARIVRKALRNSHLLVGHPAQFSATRIPLHRRAGLLYPGDGATRLAALPVELRPDQLVILDGTWHHAKTMFRDIPWLRKLPQYQLAPDLPGRYRIRREPDAKSLSTLEAVVAALRCLEPATSGFDQLLKAFDTMVEQQVAHCYPKLAWRRNDRRQQIGSNIPRILAGDLACVVVAYGESSPGGRGSKRGTAAPIYWVAQRLGTNECFVSAIESETPLSASFLRHLNLGARDLATPLSREAFCRAWASFLRPADDLVVYHQSTDRLLKQVCCDERKALVLKSVRLKSAAASGTLEDRLASAGVTSDPPQHPGRAGQRLARAVAWVRYLNTLAVAGASRSDNT